MGSFGRNITNSINNGSHNGDEDRDNSNRNNDNNRNGNENDSGIDSNSVNADSSTGEVVLDTRLDDPRVPPHIARIGGILTFSPIAGHGVIRVVQRCEDAKENNKLDLSSCELMQIPDAIYHLMRNTEITACNLSENVIKRIAPKFAINFKYLTDLNVSHNQLTRLPEEFTNLSVLTKLNISHNSFIVLPQVLFKLPKLTHLDATNNAILEIDEDDVIVSDCLAVVDLRNNPLSRAFRRKIRDFAVNFRLEISNDVEDD